MAMHDLAPLLLAALAGSLLGVCYFGALWWTVRRTLGSAHSALWQIASLLLRTGVTLAGFYAVGGGDWQRLLACLAGFVAARAVIVSRVTRAPAARNGLDAAETAHAPQP